MRKLAYTPGIILLLRKGQKLNAVKMAKDLYGLSLLDAKNMIDSYRPGGNDYYSIPEPNGKPEYTPEIDKPINEGGDTLRKLTYTPDIILLLRKGQKLNAIKMAKDLYGLSLLDAKK